MIKYIGSFEIGSTLYGESFLVLRKINYGRFSMVTKSHKYRYNTFVDSFRLSKSELIRNYQQV